MSQENVELLRHVYARWAEGDFRAGRELLDPNITTVWAQDFPTAGTYHEFYRHEAEALKAVGLEGWAMSRENRGMTAERSDGSLTLWRWCSQ